MAWLDAQATGTLFLSIITVAEFLFGIRVLPVDRRKDLLTERIDGLLEQFAARILPFDTPAARRYADLAVNARAAGQGFSKPDGHIAAIAAAHGLAVASRDASAFRAAGLKMIDPWNVGT